MHGKSSILTKLFFIVFEKLRKVIVLTLHARIGVGEAHATVVLVEVELVEKVDVAGVESGVITTKHCLSGDIFKSIILVLHNFRLLLFRDIFAAFMDTFLLLMPYYRFLIAFFCVESVGYCVLFLSGSGRGVRIVRAVILPNILILACHSPQMRIIAHIFLINRFLLCKFNLTLCQLHLLGFEVDLALVDGVALGVLHGGLGLVEGFLMYNGTCFLLCSFQKQLSLLIVI